MASVLRGGSWAPMRRLDHLLGTKKVFEDGLCVSVFVLLLRSEKEE